MFSPDMMHTLTNMNMLSPTSQCYSFDHRANGYARGEGFGILVLKRLSDALRDENTIRAIIRNTGCNQDGYTPGITQPNPISQEALIRQTYASAGLSMYPARYFESHGTGTPIGDPIESTALGSAFRKVRTLADPLLVGAVKSNIGHLEGASGMAGVIKTILVLEKAIVPPNSNFEKTNPKIDTEFLRIKFPIEPMPWPTKGLRRASVNSFGFAGTNAHVILDDVFHYLQDHGLVGYNVTVEDPPALSLLNSPQPTPFVIPNGTPSGHSSRKFKPKLLMLSANDEKGIKRQAAEYTSHFANLIIDSEQFPSYLDNLAYTLANKRTSLPWKTFTIVESLQDLQQLESNLFTAQKPISEPTLGFVFTGQGAQWAGMGHELMVYPVFERSLRECEEYLSELGSPWRLREEILKEDKHSSINRPDLSQPVCTAIQIALVDLLRNFGVYTTAVVGHSSGEIAAAYCLGAISARAAWRIAYYRGAFAASLVRSKGKQGAMISVALSESEITPYIDDITGQLGSRGLTVACINSPRNVTVSGDVVQVDMLKTIMDQEKIFARKLMVDVAYHSSHMEAIASDYSNAIQNIEKGRESSKPSAKSITMVSSVTGQKINETELSSPEYWVSNLVSPVRFSDAVSQLFARSARRVRKKLDLSHQNHFHIDMLVEIGPHSALQGPIRDILTGLPSATNTGYTSLLARKNSALESTLTAIGRLQCLGYSTDLERVNYPDEGYKHHMTLPDLPGYSFDHSKKYWHESRLSKRFRTHHQNKLDLLGKPLWDWNPLEAKWRNIIRVAEMPWVEDHVINGSMVYPGAGMLVMAIEAANQMADPTRTIVGFELKETLFQRSLNIPSDSSGIEVQLSLHLTSDSADALDSWSEFRLCAYENEKWHECCRGFIRVEYGTKTNEVDGGKEKVEELNRCRQIHDGMLRSCKAPFDSKLLYDTLNNSGFGFGPTFQPIINGAYGIDNQVKADVKLFQWPSTQYPQSHVVHPTSLDGMLHLAIASYAKGGQKAPPTMIPTLLRNLWISKKGLSYTDNETVKACAWMTAQDNRGKEFDAYVMDPSKSAVLAQIRGLRLTIVAEATTDTEDSYQNRQICYHVDYKPDSEFLDAGETSVYCQQLDTSVSPEPVQLYQDMSLLILSFLNRAIEDTENPLLNPQVQNYFEWAKRQIAIYRSTPAWPQLEDVDIELLRNRVTATRQGRLIITVGESLPGILRGELDIHNLLGESEVMDDFYRETTSDRACFAGLERYLDMLSHKTPDLKILEIGAGKGGMTAKVLGTLFNANGARYSSYHYTDVSPTYFNQAKEEFRAYPRITYSRLDIETDPIEQGYDAGAYDIIVAANVLHVHKDINVSLKNVQKLLSPGGSFIIYEPISPGTLRTTFVTGLVSGWWLTNETEVNSIWKKVLSDSGFFSDLCLELFDFENRSCQERSLLVTKSTSADLQKRHGKRIVIVADVRSDLQKGVCEKMTALLRPLDCKVHSLMDAANMPEKDKIVFIVIQELDQPFLYTLGPEDYKVLQKFVVNSKDILWVHPYGGSDHERPEYAIINGLARALRNEYEDLRLTTLALPMQRSGSELQTDIIHRVLEKNHFTLGVVGEPEYFEIDGRLTIPRVVKDAQLSQDIYVRSISQQSSTHAVKDAPPLSLTVGSSGLLDTLHFIEDQTFYQSLGDGEVEIQTHAIGMNFKDCLTALGQVPNMTFGLECAGVVTRVGPSCDVVPGNRIVMAAAASFKTFSRGKASATCKIPETMSFTEAAAIPAQFGTAWEVVHEMARLKKGETILVHAAAGGTGQAAIQIAHYLGATVLATVSSKDKKQLLVDQYGVLAKHIFYSRDTSFAKGVKRVTNGRGVDFVINSLSGESLIASWECIASYGRFVEIGKRDIMSNSSLPMFSFQKNATFMGFDASTWQEEKPVEAKRDLGILVSLFANGTFHTPRPLHVYSVSNVEQVFRLMQDGKTAGKIVLEVTPDAEVPVSYISRHLSYQLTSPEQTILRTKPSFLLSSNATYVIAGGLGGLGRTMTRWMVARNAKNLILLSRSGARTEVAYKFLEELKGEGVRVEAPACDVTDAEAMQQVFGRLSKEMPPIKGCIQGSMVRRVRERSSFCKGLTDLLSFLLGRVI